MTAKSMLATSCKPANVCHRSRRHHRIQRHDLSAARISARVDEWLNLIVEFANDRSH